MHIYIYICMYMCSPTGAHHAYTHPQRGRTLPHVSDSCSGCCCCVCAAVPVRCVCHSAHRKRVARCPQERHRTGCAGPPAAAHPITITQMSMHSSSTHMHASVCVRVCIFVVMFMFERVCVYVCVCMCVRVYMFIVIFMCVYVCVCVCVCVCTYS